MERRPQRGTNRGRSGMVARSTDGHKTNASLGAELLGGVREVKLKDASHSVEAKGDALLRRRPFDRLRCHTAGNAQGIGGAWWFA